MIELRLESIMFLDNAKQKFIMPSCIIGTLPKKKEVTLAPGPDLREPAVIAFKVEAGNDCARIAKTYMAMVP